MTLAEHQLSLTIRVQSHLKLQIYRLNRECFQLWLCRLTESKKIVFEMKVEMCQVYKVVCRLKCYFVKYLEKKGEGCHFYQTDAL